MLIGKQWKSNNVFQNGLFSNFILFKVQLQIGEKQPRSWIKPIENLFKGFVYRFSAHFFIPISNATSYQYTVIIDFGTRVFCLCRNFCIGLDISLSEYHFVQGWIINILSNVLYTYRSIRWKPTNQIAKKYLETEKLRCGQTKGKRKGATPSNVQQINWCFNRRILIGNGL